MKPLFFAVLALCLCSTLGIAASAHATPVGGPEINPFSCQGDAAAAEDDRSIAQIELELAKKLDPPFEPSDAPSVRAEKLCVIARLKARVGQADAREYFEEAIQANPDEPGYSLFAGEYYAGARGAKGPVIELAERYYYQALEQLERLKASGRYRAFHAVVEDHLQKDLLVLYQADGLALVPWKAFPQHANGYLVPAISVSDQVSISRDTRAVPGGNDTAGFTAEAGLFAQSTRANRQPNAAELFQIARQPVRFQNDLWLNFRQPFVGELSLQYSTMHAKNAAITKFVDPFGLNDIDVKELGVEYQRVLALYPLFDLKLRARVSEVSRTGVVEYLPTCQQNFPVYEFKPAVSRFLGSDKLTLNGTYVFMDIHPICGATDYTGVRGRSISAVNLEYAIYSPLLLPALGLGSLRPYRTSTRGLYLNAGYVNDNEVFGDHRVINRTFFAGARLEGPGAYDLGFSENYAESSGTVIEAGPVEVPSSELSSKILRTSLTVTRRLLNPDETPGVPNSTAGFANHALNWVFPVSVDNVLSRAKDYENFRIGSELWWQVFGTSLGGASLLTTVGYDYEYFYRLPKHTHNVFITARLGWRDL